MKTGDKVTLTARAQARRFMDGLPLLATNTKEWVDLVRALDIWPPR